MKFTFYGHSCFGVMLQNKNVLFDPFIKPNQLAQNIDVSKIKADFILVSHGHGDHVADLVEIAKNTGATVVSSFEIIDWVQQQGIKNVHPMNHGGKKTFEFGEVKCVNAVHSSSLPDGTYGGNPMGFVINSADGSFYYSGDTALTTDMKLIPLWAKLNCALLCIGDNFTMGYEDAIEAARMIKCNKIVGVHFDTFPYIKIDHEKVKQAFADAGMELILPQIGETIEL